MKSRVIIRRGLQGLAGLIFAGLGVASTQAAIVLSDTFNYADGASMASAGWTQSYGGAASIITIDGGANSVAALANRGAFHDLSSAVTTDFTLTVVMAANNFGRANYVLITSAPDGLGAVSGYGFQWNTAASGQFSNQGFLQLRKFSNISSFGTGSPGNLSWDDGLGADAVTSGEDIIQPGNTVPTVSSQFGTFSISWAALTNTLTLRSGATVLSTEVDNDFAAFSRVYISGNSTGYFDSITLDAAAVPEPGSCAALAGMAALGLVTRRRRRMA